MRGSEARQLLGIPDSWPLIPARDDGEGKRPIARWAGVDWPKFDHWSAPLWAIPTGKVTGVVVLDFDGEAGAKVLTKLGESPHVRTGSGGHHLYVANPLYPVKTVAGIKPGVDVRGEGGIAYVAGSSQKGAYTLLRPLTSPVAYGMLSGARNLLLPRTERATAPPATWLGTEPGTMASVAFVLKAVQRIKDAEPGTWNRTFHTAVYAIAGLVAGGTLAEGWALDTLRGIGLDAASETALVSSWARGFRAPWLSGGAKVILGVTDTRESA